MKLNTEGYLASDLGAHNALSNSSDMTMTGVKLFSRVVDEAWSAEPVATDDAFPLRRTSGLPSGRTHDWYPL